MLTGPRDGKSKLRRWRATAVKQKLWRASQGKQLYFENFMFNLVDFKFTLEDGDILNSDGRPV